MMQLFKYTSRCEC